jgi:hypothetical protein
MPILGEDVQTGAPKLFIKTERKKKKRLKDSDFSLVCLINWYLNLNKQQSLVFEDQF